MDQLGLDQSYSALAIRWIEKQVDLLSLIFEGHRSVCLNLNFCELCFWEVCWSLLHWSQGIFRLSLLALCSYSSARLSRAYAAKLAQQVSFASPLASSSLSYTAYMATQIELPVTIHHSEDYHKESHLLGSSTLFSCQLGCGVHSYMTAFRPHWAASADLNCSFDVQAFLAVNSGYWLASWEYSSADPRSQYS